MFKPLAVYASFAFIAIQVIDVVIKRLFFPDWIGTFVVVVILIGFPITFFISWIYDITPEGIKKINYNALAEPSKTKNVSTPGGLCWFFICIATGNKYHISCPVPAGLDADICCYLGAFGVSNYYFLCLGV